MVFSSDTENSAQPPLLWMDLDLQIPGALLSLCTHSRRCACPDSLSVCVLSRSGVSDFLRPQWIITRQAPLSMGFPRQEYWNGLPFPPPEDLPDPGMEPTSPASPASAGGFSTTEAPGRPILSQAKKIRQVLACWPSDSVCASLSLSSQALLCIPARDSCHLCFRGSAGSEAAYL